MSPHCNGQTVPQRRVSVLEQGSPRFYQRTIFCFKLVANYNIEEVAHVLRQGLRATYTQLPFLTGRIVVLPDEDGKAKSRVDLFPSETGELEVSDIRSDDRWDYDELRARHFPNSAFDDAVFFNVPCMLSPQELEPGSAHVIPVLGLQATFIRGGWILGFSFMHSVLDGQAMSTVMEVWAKGCRHAQSIFQDAEGPKLEENDIRFDRLGALSDADEYRGSVIDHPEYVYGYRDQIYDIQNGDVEEATPIHIFGKDDRTLKGLNANLQIEVFHISPSKLAALKTAASPAIGWVSTNDALAALLWRTLIAATYPSIPTSSSVEENLRTKTSTLQIAIDTRARLSPPLPTHYLGDAHLLATTSLTLHELLLPSNLPLLALSIRQAILAMTAPHIRDVVALMRNCPDYTSRMPRFCVDLLRSGMLITSWSGFGCYGVDWGGKVGGRCERVRGPRGGMWNGRQTVLPALPGEGGGEVLVGVEEEVMRRVKGDRVWREYVTGEGEERG